MSAATAAASVDDIIKNAQAAAAAHANSAAGNLVAPNGNLPAVANTNLPAVAPTVGKKLTMAQVASLAGGMTPDAWLAVKEVGLLIKDSPTSLTDELFVIIDLKAVAAAFTVKYDENTFFKTYDMQNCLSGGTWAQALQSCAAAGNSPYPSADIPMTLCSDWKDKKGKETFVEAGKLLGHSPSKTSFSYWADFWGQMVAAGHVTLDANDEVVSAEKVKVKLGFASRTNRKKQSWGSVTFEFIEVVGDDEAE